MTDQELDRLMRRVLLDSLKREYTAETVAVMPYKLSWRHHRQMDAMLKNPLKWLRNKTKPVWKKVIQRVAVVLLTVSLSLGGLMAVSPTVRAAVIRWVTEWYETHVSYRYNGEDITTEMPQYDIQSLPRGYVEIDRTSLPSTASVIYENNSGDLICFDYSFMQQGTATVLAPRDDVVVDVEINGMSGHLFVPIDTESAKTVTWIDKDANVQFIINTFCSENDILHMAESVALVKNTNS